MNDTTKVVHLSALTLISRGKRIQEQAASTRHSFRPLTLEGIRTSTGRPLDQYWSRSEVVLVDICDQYWSDR
ncbi:hypothetical protein HMPREF3185_00795 [Porphyromonas somerae]|uniref:Uncharacterized protein n=1 Tax=Porphyromonas somerae TaxID=322095 RepID=A0A134B9T0_9PORP|nr:hypothetical protein HMPREF3184_00795 [Porphyromonadaceae bacterium KA00676]KXB76684.1 hypothetical protein HMPREF3185_00795 [Porphyromonas somerae]